MISKTKINQRMRKKTNSILVETLFLAKKSNIELASALAVPTKKQAKINVGRLNEVKGEVALVPGKVLSSGEINKKIKVYALGFSEKAIEKLKKAGCTFNTLHDILKKDKKVKGEIVK